MTFVMGIAAGYLICWVALRAQRHLVMRFFNSAKEFRQLARADVKLAEEARAAAHDAHQEAMEERAAGAQWAQRAEESGRRADEVWAAAREELAKARAIVGEQTSES